MCLPEELKVFPSLDTTCIAPPPVPFDAVELDLTMFGALMIIVLPSSEQATSKPNLELP